MARMQKDVARTTPEDAPEELKERARDLASDTGSHVADRANDLGDRGMSAVGERVDRAARYIDERRGRETPLGERLHGTASWMREHDTRDMMSAVDRAVHEHPYRTMAIGVAVGYLVGRLLSR